MAKLTCNTTEEFKSILYQRYSTEQVQLSIDTVQDVLKQRRTYQMWMIATCLPSDKSTRILDLGCGYGGILYFLREAGYTQVTGVDVSPEQIDFARKLGLENVHCQDVRQFLGDVPDGAFDAVIAFDILEHFTKPELFNLLSELHRILALNGKLIVHVPNGEGLFFGKTFYSDLTHEQVFTRASLSQWAHAIGFRLLTVKEDTPLVHGLTSLVRNLIWRTGSSLLRLLCAAESGGGHSDMPLTANLLAILERL